MVEHIFVVGRSGKQFELVLDFQELVEGFFYLSGRYVIELIVGDAVMENSLLQVLGHIDLDLPEPLEKAPRPPPQPADPCSRYGPKAEILHISREDEKVHRKHNCLESFFASLATAPTVLFYLVVGDHWVNDRSMRNFPSKVVFAIYAVLFQLGIGAVLTVYVYSWKAKWDLFTTMKVVCLVGALILLIGRKVLS